MPVFQLELQFDDKGALVGAKKLGDIAAAADAAAQGAKNVTAAVDDATKAAKGMTTAIDAVWKTLGARSTSTITADMKAVVTAFREVKGNAASTAQDVSRAYAAMREKLRKLSDEAKISAKATREISEQFSQAATKIGMFGNALEKLAGVAAGLFAVNKLKDAALYAFNLASQYETLGIVVQQVGKVSGYSAVETDRQVGALRSLGIAGLEARQTMTQLIQAQVDLANASKLARVAQDAAVIGSTNSSAAFERLVHGIQSAQTDVLRTIGISVNFEQAYAKVAAQIGKAVDELTEQEKVQARANAVLEAGSRIAGSYEAAMASVGKQLGSLSRIHKDFATDVGALFTSLATGTGVVDLYSKAIQGLTGLTLISRGLANGLSFDEMLNAAQRGEQALRGLVEATVSADTESSAFTASITAVSGALGAVNTAWFMTQLAQLDTDLKNKVLNVDQYRRAVNELNVLMKAQLNQPPENAPKTGGFGVKDEVEALRKSYKESASGKRDDEIKKIKAQQEKLQLYRNEFSNEEYSKLNKGLEDRLKSLNSSADSAASKAENAAEKWKQFGLEIDALNGKGTKTAVTLEKQNKEIEDAGKAAGKSASEISQIQADYAAAFQSNTLKEFNKHVVELEGNTAALRDLKIEEEVRKWTTELSSAGVAGADLEGKITRLKDALAKQAEVKDAQTSLSFIKEYSQLSGDFSQNQKILLEMLEREAEVYRATLPASLQPYIDKWQELKKLQEARDPLSGSIRGLRSYSNEAMNLAKGIEGAWTGGFTAMEDAMVKFTMSGKLSFSDMANSIISDLMRIAIRSSITGPLASGLGSIFSGMFSGGSSALPVIGGPSGGGVVPAYIHHAGGMVDGSGPTRTVSAYDYLHAPRFHSGGGFFKRDEYPAILQYGERVLNRQETAAYNAREWAGRDVMGRSGAAAQATPQVFVSIQNNTGAEVSQETRTDNMGRKNIRVIIGDAAASQMVTAGSSLDKATRARFGIQPQATRR